MLLEKIAEQLFLTTASLFVAILISVPLGIAIAKTDRFKKGIISLVSAIQTIPSLAVLAFLIPFVGIGAKPAIIALSLYALLPVLQNTVTGLNNVQPLMIEAANSLGFTRAQKLRLVELPLAFPVIVAGIRTAAAMCVGIATLAAFVGAGGLGDFIYQGLSLNNNRLLMMGAVPAAALALSIDFLLGTFQKTLGHDNRKTVSIVSKALSLIVIIALTGIMLSHFLLPLLADKKTIKIGSKASVEQMLLAEMAAQSIEKNTTFKVKRTYTLPGLKAAKEALLNNEIDLYPTYSGTAYFVLLKGDPNTFPPDMYGYVKNKFYEKYDIVWLAPFGFSNKNALAISKAFSEKYNIQKMSELVPYANQIEIAVPEGFMQRPDGYAGLKSKYGIKFKKVRLMEHNLGYKALDSKDVTAILAYTTDSQLQIHDAVVLEDDKKLFPEYHAALITMDKFLKKHPEVYGALKPLFGKINEKTIQGLSYKVEMQQEKLKEVAREFVMAID